MILEKRTMQNDVVRWSAVKNQQISNISSKEVAQQTNAEITATSTAQCCSNKHVAKAAKQQRQHICCSSTLSYATDAIICDINKFNEISSLAQNTKVKSLSKQKQKPQQQQQQQNQAEYEKQVENCLLTHNVSRRTLTHLNFSKFFLFCLQISAVVFVSNLNFGVITVSAAINDNSLNLKLDYELPAKSAAAPLSKNDSLSGTSDETAGHYTHTWAVHIPNGDSGLADEVAREHGFTNHGKIFSDHYHFSHHKVSKRSLAPATEHQSRLYDDHRVHWAKQQKAKSRRKRDFIRMRPSRTSSRATSQINAVSFTDPKWPQMWYLNRGGGLDMNVIPAWREGITGKGVVVTILDDGLESDHPDIEQNYDPKASYDVNNHDDDPMPHYDMTDSNRHGTRCAGEVAATANNSICAVGIAYGASVGGVRMLDGDVTDAVEARSLSLNPQHIDIYSASWGPDDDGKTVDGPGELASRAFIEGVTKGRQGKGSIFIWASGNGGREQDNCNCDGYTNSIWTLSISSATEEGHVPWYSEKCSSTLATTYSSGAINEKQVVTTDLHHSCTVSHTGTSASAPLAAGIAALVLQSNQNLTWRDLQHIVVRTAQPANLKDPTWTRNGVGRRISHSFGYGLMDAAGMVRAARSWKTVPEQQRCEINAPHVDKMIRPKNYITLQLTVRHCLSVNYLEHVQAKITLSSQRRGDIQLYLKSPAGTKVTLLTSRIHDASRSGFNQWPFMSVHTWGESPHGNWQLEIHNDGRFMAQISQWDLIFYGTETPAQPDDRPNKGQFTSFGDIDIDNGIDEDPDSVQEVGETQRMSLDKTSTACVKTLEQKCLACAANTYYYNWRCYDQCPINTFALSPNKTKLADTADIATNQLSLFNGEEQDLESMDRRKRSNSLRALTATDDTVKDSPNVCAKCDVSCMRCYGPRNYQCSTCYPGSQLRKQLHNNETYCYVFAERSSGNNHADELEGIEKTNGHGHGLVPGLKLLLFMSLFFALGYISFVAFKKLKRRPMRYDRVALLPDLDAEIDDEVQMSSDMKPNVSYRNEMSESKTALIDSVISDASESEEEVFVVTRNTLNVDL